MTMRYWQQLKKKKYIYFVPNTCQVLYMSSLIKSLQQLYELKTIINCQFIN